MITYVNTVLVNNAEGVMTSAITPATSKDVTNAGKFIVVDNDGTVLNAATAKDAEAIKIGKITDKFVEFVDKTTGVKKYMPVVKWSNIIKKDDIKSYHKDLYEADSEDTVYIDFTTVLTALNALEVGEKLRIVVRLTFKDMPTRFRKWTESYEVVMTKGSANVTSSNIINEFCKSINVKNMKRARVIASGIASYTSAFAETAASVDSNGLYTDAAYLKIEAMPYDDDEVVDSISPANKVRFSANSWYTNPAAKGLDSKNKYTAASVVKNPGKYYTASAKLVRDAEANAMGYAGIINRGEGTWPIIKPEMAVKLDGMYDAITLEFENMYRTADDLQRKTKQMINIFVNGNVSGTYTSSIAPIANIIEAFVAGVDTTSTVATAAQIKAGTKDIKD